MPRSHSPLRYPGGKSSLAPFLERVINENELRGCVYVEPFCGGAGAALKLLFSNVVKKIHINDVDPAIYSFWRAVLTFPDAFIRRIENVPLTIGEWKLQKEIYRSPDSAPFDKGFATFFLNRCNRSGILSANPIGGINQTGKWSLSARFNKKMLINKIVCIAERAEDIKATNLDVFGLFELPEIALDNVFIYLDPPYFHHGPQLYLNAFNERQHTELSDKLKDRRLKWIMTYDDAHEIHMLYDSWCHVSQFGINHHAYTAKKSRELLISPPHIVVDDLLISNYGKGRDRHL